MKKLPNTINSTRELYQLLSEIREDRTTDANEALFESVDGHENVTAAHHRNKPTDYIKTSQLMMSTSDDKNVFSTAELENLFFTNILYVRCKRNS